MADLTAKFRLVDEMSDKMANMAETGQNMVNQWEQAGEATSAAFNGISGAVSTATGAVDGIATSIDNVQEAASNAASATDYWTEAVGNYDKGCLEAVYSTEELVEMGFKTQDALEAAAAAAEKDEKALGELTEAEEKTGEAAEDAGEKGTNAFESLSSALTSLGIVATVKEIAEAVYELADAFSEAESIVVKATGATGEALDDLTDSMMNAYAASKGATLDDTAAAIGEINTRMGLTGDTLTDVTGKFLDFSEITGTNVVGSVQSVTKIMNKWNVEGSEVESVLDKLAYAGQISGISVDSLANTVTNSSATFQALGLDLDNTIALLAELELYGTNSTTAVMGLRTAVNNFAKDGLDAEDALRDVINQIATMEDTTAATALAVETFGSRAGQELAGAIRSGAISVDTLTKSLDVADGTLAKTADQAQTLEQKWAEASNNMKAAFTNAVEPTVNSISGAFAELVSGVGKFLQQHPTLTKAITAIGIGLGVVVAGVAGVTFVTTVAIPALTAFGVALNTALGPIGWVALAITGITVAVGAMIAMMSDAEDEVAGLTATSQEQYYELQNLNAEYEAACEKYGDTSEEALRLKYQVDDLSESFEANKQTVEEFIAEIDEMCESIDKSRADYEASIKEIHDNEVGTLALIQKYEDLAKKVNRTAAEQEAFNTVTEKLADTFPDLAESMDLATVSTEQYVAAMKAALGEDAEQQRRIRDQERYVELLVEQAELEEKIAKAEQNLKKSQEADDSAWFLSDRWFYDKTGWLGKWATQTDEYKDSLSKLRAEYNANATEITEIEGRWEKLADTTEEVARTQISAQGAVREAIASVKDEINELIEEYDRAYEAAASSIQSTIGVFNQMSIECETSTDQMIAALKSQSEWITTYTENLKRAAEIGLDEGLIQSLSDGSEESAGYINAIVTQFDELSKAAEGNKAADFIDEMNSSFSEVQEAKDEFAETVAEMETDFSEKMDAIGEKMDDLVKEMNMQDEAANAAILTLDAYINAIKSKQGEAEAAAKAIAQAAAINLAGGNYVSMDGIYAFADPEAEMQRRIQEAAGNAGVPAANPTYDLFGAYGPSGIVPGHANGTTDAESAFIAGENGPELILGRQGSEVFPAAETNRIIDAIKDNPLSVMPEASERGATGTQEKKIVLEVAGSGAIEVSGKGADRESILQVLQEQIKPVLMNIIQTEIYEEGQLSYDY